MQALKRNQIENPVWDIFKKRSDEKLRDEARAIRERHDAHVDRLYKIPAQIGQAICTIVPIPMTLWAGLSVAEKTTPVDNIHLAGALGVAFIAATMLFKFRHDFAKAVKTKDYNGLLDDLVDFRSKRTVGPKKDI